MYFTFINNNFKKNSEFKEVKEVKEVKEFKFP